MTRSITSIHELHELHMETGQGFPVSGDAKLRRSARLLKARMDRAYTKAVLNDAYGKAATSRAANIAAGYSCIDHMHSTYADTDSISC